MESIMEHVAKSINKDATEIREMNMYTQGQVKLNPFIYSLTHYCRNPIIIVQKLRHFIISLLLRKIFTSNLGRLLVCAFVLSQLVYSNSLLSNAPKYINDKLQRVQNCADGLIV